MEGIEVRAEPEDVYNYVSDYATLPEWCVIAGELVAPEGTPESSLAVGSTFRMLSAAHSDEPYYAWKSRGEHTAQVTDLVPGSRIVWRLDHGRPLHIVVQMQRQTGGTIVTLETHTEDPGWLRWAQALFLLPFIPLRWLQARSREYSWVGLIKSRVESGQQSGKAPGS